MSEIIRISVGINSETHGKLKEYVDERGLKITFMVDKIIEKFLSEVDKTTPPGI